jgi:hypothetical protein
MDTLSPRVEAIPTAVDLLESGNVSANLIGQHTASAAAPLGQPWKAIINDLIQRVEEDPSAKDNFPCQYGLAAHSLAA